MKTCAVIDGLGSTRIVVATSGIEKDQKIVHFWTTELMNVSTSNLLYGFRIKSFTRHERKEDIGKVQEVNNQTS